MHTLTQPLAPAASEALSLAPESGAHHTCLNCDHPVPDRYCGRCGQDAHHTYRLTLKDMPHDVLHSIWHVDKGILYTLKTMIRRPGLTIRAYLAGKRVDHFRPLSLLFMITGFYALLWSMLHIDLMPQRDPNMPEAVYQMSRSSMNFMTKYMSWFYVATVPVWALFARWLLRRGSFNYAECLIIVSYITAICNFLSLLYLPFMYIYNGTPQMKLVMYIPMALTIVYASWAYGSMLNHTSLSRFGRFWRGLLTYALGYIVVIFTCTMLMYALNWSTVKAAFKQQYEAGLQKQAQKQSARPAQSVPAPQPH